MKRLMLALLMTLPLMAAAQNTWEMPDPQNPANPDQKYMAGAVPEVDGKVVFSTTIKAPGKSAREIYDILLEQMTRMTKEPNQFEQSRVAVADTAQWILGANYQEWLVFKSTALVLDRTRLFFRLTAECADGEVQVKMQHIAYLYEEERIPQQMKAEEWITDKYGLNKKKTKLARVSGKFRRKTIDRKDYIFGKFEKLLNP